MNGLGFALLIALYPILTWIYSRTTPRHAPTPAQDTPHE